MAMKRESTIQKEILAYLRNTGYSVWKMPLGPQLIHAKGRTVMAKNALKGFPDIFGILKNIPGKLFVIEVKSATGKLRPEQKMWLARLEKLGVSCLVARTLQEVIEFLKEEDK